MNSRERVLTTMNHEEPDRVPIIMGVSNATSIKMETYRKLKQLLGIEAEDHYLYDWVELGTDGGFMATSVHTMMNDVPSENILAVVDAVVEFGQY